MVQYSIHIGTQPSPVDSMREATFTVSPKRQYLGITCPTTPAQYSSNTTSIIRLLGLQAIYRVKTSLIRK